MSFSVGSRTMRMRDLHDDIQFETWILYPAIDTETQIKVGPFEVNACLEGNYAGGRFPLVVISHGGGGSHLLYRTVASYLAQNGYWVAMPEHHRNNRNDNSLGDADLNLTLRTRHVQLVIDTLLEDPETSHYIDATQIYMIGHSMGGATALSIAGAIPWSFRRTQIDVTTDSRVRAIVLLAPATAWFQHPDSLLNVRLPVYIFSAEEDHITPVWQAEMLLRRAVNPSLVQLEIVENAGHMSFLAPFPKEMTHKHFLPSQDPDGFDREAFHEDLKNKILHFFNRISLR